MNKLDRIVGFVFMLIGTAAAGFGLYILIRLMSGGS